MVTPINLNKIRKTKAKAAKTANATQNRLKFGQTKLDKQLATKRAKKVASDLEGLKIDT